MKSRFHQSLALCAIVLAAATAAPPAVAASKETIAMSVGRLLEEGHYTRQKLNEEISKKFLQSYLELLERLIIFLFEIDQILSILQRKPLLRIDLRGVRHLARPVRDDDHS